MRILLLLPAALVMVACNSTLKGEAAPAISGEGWLGEASVATSGRWVLVEFFKPT